MKKRLLLVSIIMLSIISIAQAGQTATEGSNVTIGTYITPFNTSGYQVSFLFDEKYLKVEKVESGKLFRIRQTYFGSIATNNSLIAFEFLIGKDSAVISGSLVNITFKTLNQTDETDIILNQYLLGDENGNVNRSFQPTVYETIKITRALPITYQSLMEMVNHFADPQYDITGDGTNDIEDFIKFSRQLS